MKESIGYTVSLNIMIVFITIVVAFLCAALIYFKSNKASNIITSAIEKYEGYSLEAQNEIALNLNSLGYGSRSVRCENPHEDKDGNGLTDDFDKNAVRCDLIETGQNGYCVYICYEENNFDLTTNKYLGEYYYYKIRTNMMITVPILNDFMDIPIYSNTNRLYYFK